MTRRPHSPLRDSLFSEAIRWQNPTGFQAEFAQKQIEDSLAVGGLRNTAGSVDKLHYLSQTGAIIGRTMVDALMRNLTQHRESDKLKDEDAWINATCSCIGREDAKPPKAAVEAIKAILYRHTSHCMPEAPSGKQGLSSLDTRQLEA